jgi:hypothetical protein
VVSLLIWGAANLEVPTLEKTATSQSAGTSTMPVYRMHTGRQQDDDEDYP